MDSGKLLLRGYKFKETKPDRFEKKPAATEAEEIDDRSKEADVSALRRSIERFSFSFLFFYDRLTTSDYFCVSCLALKVDIFRSAWQKSIAFFAARLAESSLPRELACGPLFVVLHLFFGPRFVVQDFGCLLWKTGESFFLHIHARY